MLKQLADNVERTLQHTIEKEEKVPLEQVTNFREVCILYSVQQHA